MDSSASISPCSQYRWQLRRDWSETGPSAPAVFVMLNPSTADASEDDPTIRRCIRYAKDWGCDGLVVVNLYALRSAAPAALWAHHDPVGALNDEYIAGAIAEESDVICAWGGNAKHQRVAEFVRLVEFYGGRMFCLGTTKAGQPRHPLYLKRTAPLTPWPVLGEGNEL